MNNSKIQQNSEKVLVYLKGLGCSTEDSIKVLTNAIIKLEDDLE